MCLSDKNEIYYEEKKITYSDNYLNDRGERTDEREEVKAKQSRALIPSHPIPAKDQRPLRQGW